MERKKKKKKKKKKIPRLDFETSSFPSFYSSRAGMDKTREKRFSRDHRDGVKRETCAHQLRTSKRKTEKSKSSTCVYYNRCEMIDKIQDGTCA